MILVTLIIGALMSAGVIAVWVCLSLVASAVAGFQPRQIRLWALTVTLRPLSLSWSWKRRGRIGAIGAVMYSGDPHESAEQIRRRLQRFDLSRAGVSLVLGIVALGYGLATSAETVWGTFAGFLGSGLLASAVVSVWYWSQQRRPFSKSADEVEAHVAAMAIWWDDYAGRRPRDWQLTRARFIDPDHPEFHRSPLGLYPGIIWTLDRGEIGRARALLDQAIAEETELGNTRTLAVLHELRSYILGRFVGDPSAAEEDLRASRRYDRSADVTVAQAAVALAKGDLAGARRFAEQGLRNISAANPGFAAMETDWYLDLIAMATPETAVGWRTAA